MSDPLLLSRANSWLVAYGHVGTGTQLITDLLAALASAQAELAAANIALCSLTPGGSEYANNPAACVAHVRRVREEQHAVIVKMSHEVSKWKQLAEQRAAGYDATRCSCVFDSTKMDDPTRECDYHREQRERAERLAEFLSRVMKCDKNAYVLNGARDLRGDIDAALADKEELHATNR